MLVFEFTIFLFSIALSRQLSTDELRSTSLENQTNPVSSCGSNSAELDEHCMGEPSEALQNRTISTCRDATSRGRYMLKLNNQTLPFPVFCLTRHNVGGGGWILIQQRIDDSENFARSWVDYREGFGNMYRNYWLGLERIHQITNSGHYELVVDATRFDGTAHWAYYTRFAIDGEDDKYRLRDLGTFSGQGGDGLRTHLSHRFSTFDSENDAHATWHCSVRHTGGWWFSNTCISGSNLNGLHQIHNMHTSSLWDTAAGHWARIFTRMLLRRVGN